jgi:hypothetical protein
VPDNDETPLLRPAQRVWAWIGLLALCVHSVVVAYKTHDDTWMLSITVAVMVAMVIVIDDRRRHRSRHRALGPSTSDSSVAADEATTDEGRESDPR